jgi:hypothetical protein
MAITVKYRKDIINSLLGTTTGSSNSFSAPFSGSERYIGLSFKKPAIDGANVEEPWPASDAEKDANGYGRALIAKAGQSLTIMFGQANDDGEAKNSSHIYFPEATAAWEDRNPTPEEKGLKYFVIFNSATSKTKDAVLAYAPLTDENGDPSPIEVKDKNTVVLFRKNDLVVKYVDIYEDEEEGSNT